VAVEEQPIEDLIYSYVINLRAKETQQLTFEQYVIIVRKLGYNEAENRIRAAKRMLNMVEN